jgi:nucleoside-diphosphate-sugar epimerase
LQTFQGKAKLMRVLVTGANGFVGKALCTTLADKKHKVIACTRGGVAPWSSEYEYATVTNIDSNTHWREHLLQIDVVVHLAARVHVMSDHSTSLLDAYQEVNYYGTLNLARQAAQAGIKRFIYMSSIKVNGEKTLPERPFNADDVTVPADAYGISKFEAERGLLALAEETGLEVVIIRPPLVYGPGVKGNFASMMRWVQAGWPLPLGVINNRRSLVSLDNLISLIITCIDHPAAANQIFLVSDGEDLSTTDLLRRLAKAAGVPSRLIPVPAGLLMFGLTLLGKKMIAQRLLGSLQVDISKTRELLGWTPPVSVDEGLKRCFTVED